MLHCAWIAFKTECNNSKQQTLCLTSLVTRIETIFKQCECAAAPLSRALLVFCFFRCVFGYIDNGELPRHPYNTCINGRLIPCRCAPTDIAISLVTSIYKNNNRKKLYLNSIAKHNQWPRPTIQTIDNLSKNRTKSYLQTIRFLNCIECVQARDSIMDFGLSFAFH